MLEGYYRLLFDANPLPMWVYDRHSLAFLAVNVAAVRHYGYTRDEFLAMTIADIHLPADRPALRANVAQPRNVIAGAGVWRQRTKDGRVIDVEITTQDIRFMGRDARLVVAHDVTERNRLKDEHAASLQRERRAHAELKEAVRRKDETLALLDTLLSSAPVGMAFVDRDLRYLRINDWLARMNGRTVDEHLGRTAWEIIPAFAPTLDRIYQQIERTGEPVVDMEVRGASFNQPGEPHDYLVSYYPVRDADGRMLGMGSVVVDITEQKRAEAERERLLQQIEDERVRLEAVLQQMPSGVIIAEAPSGKAILGNRQVEQIWRHSFFASSDIAEYSAYKGFHPDGRPYAPEEWPLARAINAGEIVTCEEIDILRGDGTRGTIEVSAAPIRDQGGTIVAAVAIFHDVTERKQALDTLKRSQEQLRTVVSNAPLILFAIDRDGVLTLSEGKGLAALELEPGQVVGQSVFDLYAGVPQVLDDIRQALQGKHVTAVRDVGGIVFETHYTPVLSAHSDGEQPVGVIGVAIDVTERKHAEDALRESEERLRLAMEAAQMGTWDWNIVTGDITRSPQLERLYGFAPGTMPRSYEQFLNYVHPDDRAAVLRAVDEALTGSGEYHAEFRIIWSDGTVRWIAGTGQAIYEDQRPVRMIGISRDISERKRAEAERALLLDRAQAARAAAEAALNVREQFLSVASHELKTPLTALMGYAGLLERRLHKEPALDARERRAITAIARQANRLHDLVVSLFDLARIRTGQLGTERKLLDLNDVAQRVVDEIHDIMPQSCRLHFRPFGQPLPVLGDEARLEQVLHNLLQNAIKYSPSGGDIEVWLDKQDDHASVAVRDDGIGIPADSQPHLFQRFFRAANVDEQQISGLGVGLYVAHEIVARHGGTIDVESSEGDGSTFTVRLPLADGGNRE